MKKKNLTLSIMIFLCAALVFGFSACAHKHAHTYDRQVISENYLAEKQPARQKQDIIIRVCAAKKAPERLNTEF